MAPTAAVGNTSAPAVVTVEVLQPVPFAQYNVRVTAIAAPPAAANITVNGETPAAIAGDVVTLPGVRLRAVAAGDATVTVGPPPDAGTTTTVLKWTKNLLRLQLWIGAGLIAAGGLLVLWAVVFTHRGDLTIIPAQAGPTVTTTTLAVVPPATAGVATTAAAPIGGNLKAPGGATSSDTSLVQTVALAMITAGATLIPTGAANVLAAKVKNQE